MTRRPLEGLLVLDLTQLASGPYGTMMLADAGANVVKIERPRHGDPSRSLPPFRHDETGRSIAAGILRFGRNKRSLALDLGNESGKAVFLDLVSKADILWENFVGGTMERFGLGYDRLRQVNPRLIYAAISGFGRAGSLERDRTALDFIAQAESGLMAVSGEADGPPAQVGAVIGDIVPGLYAVIGTLYGLIERGVTGKGCLVNVSMVDALLALNERAILLQSLTGQTITRGALGHAGPYDRFRAKDGYIVIAASIPSLWERLCEAIGRTDLLEHAPNPDPEGVWWRFGDVMRPVLEPWIASRTCAEALAVLRQHAVPAARVATVEEAGSSAHAAARGMILEGQHPVAGTFKLVGSPIKMSSMPEPEARPAPDLGQHSDEVLRELLDYGDAEIEALRSKGAIG